MTCVEFGRALDPQLSPAGVRQAERDGRIKAAAKTASGVRLFDHAELERFQRERAARARAKAA